ncbi:MAG: ATP synthase F1 subunit gamma [Patescibacteria group bacterium]|jgi:F-type H+-transporting ATPase subunit gamma
MPANTRDIKRRLRSISSTKQITKAMELVAAAKMRRAVQAVQSSRSYANLAWMTVQNLAQRTDRRLHALLRRNKSIRRKAILLITSNRGLCGGFNQQITKLAIEKYQATVKAGIPVDFIVMGRRGRDVLLRQGLPIVAEFEKQDVVSNTSEIFPVARLLIDDFKAEKYDRVWIAYTDFKSALKQEAVMRQLLPIEKRKAVIDVAEPNSQEANEDEMGEYLFEPSPDEVLGLMLQSIVEIQIYQAVLESNASEHSARMMAMRNASDNAEEYMSDLQLYYNQARQANITRDLAEISASRAVLES